MYAGAARQQLSDAHPFRRKAKRAACLSPDNKTGIALAWLKSAPKA
jgi:hypothetical protein